MDVEATRSIRQAEVGAVKTMIDRVKKVHNLMPERLIADTAYGSGPMLDWLVEKRGIAPHIPVIDKSGRKDGTFERADFTFDTDNDLYICPGGKELKQYRRAFKTPRSGVSKDETVRCRARKSDCDACTFKERCCPKEPQRKVTRSIYETSRDVARVLSQTHNMQSRVNCAKRSRCHSHISNEYTDLDGSDYVDHAALTTNLSSRQPSKTSKSSQN